MGRKCAGPVTVIQSAGANQGHVARSRELPSDASGSRGGNGTVSQDFWLTREEHVCEVMEGDKLAKGSGCNQQ